MLLRLADSKVLLYTSFRVSLPGWQVVSSILILSSGYRYFNLICFFVVFVLSKLMIIGYSGIY